MYSMLHVYRVDIGWADDGCSEMSNSKNLHPLSMAEVQSLTCQLIKASEIKAYSTHQAHRITDTLVFFC